MSMRARRAAPFRAPAAGPVVGLVAGVGAITSVFLPWYTTNVAAPFTASSSSGWDSTQIAKAVLVLGVIGTLASILLLLDVRGTAPLDVELARALGWLSLGTFAAVAALVGYRLLRLPEPSAFLSRDIGLYVGVAAGAAGVLAAIAQLSSRA
jgi:hypothetical protein